MIRLEIIANNTVEEDILEAMDRVEKGFFLLQDQWCSWQG